MLLIYPVTCPSLNFENGELNYNTSLLNGGYPVSTMASFSCNQYFNREEPSSVTCQNSGNWSEDSPTCNASNKNMKFYLKKNKFPPKRIVCSEFIWILNIQNLVFGSQINLGLLTTLWCQVIRFLTDVINVITVMSSWGVYKEINKICKFSSFVHL